MSRHPRLELNAVGPFYTTGECLACTMPEAEAPECLAPLSDDNNYHTYFLRQPETSEEIERVCVAAEVCCVSAIRYSGNEQTIIRRLGNREEYCDNLLPGGPVRFPWETDEQWAVANGQARRPWWRFWRK